MQYHYIFFDLDGTLADPFVGICGSVKYALEKMGVPKSEIHNLGRFIGPPLVYSFKEYYGMTPEEADRAVDFYRETYSVKGVLQNHLYPGITELMQKLTGEGRQVFLATSKPLIFAEKIIDYFDLKKYFTRLEGAPLSRADVEKSYLIDNIINDLHIPDRSKCVMVGDRRFDMEGAKGSGITGIGVLYGYGSRQELIDSGADYLVNDVYELIRLFDRL